MSEDWYAAIVETTVREHIVTREAVRHALDAVLADSPELAELLPAEASDEGGRRFRKGLAARARMTEQLRDILDDKEGPDDR